MVTHRLVEIVQRGCVWKQDFAEHTMSCNFGFTYITHFTHIFKRVNQKENKR